MLSSLALFFFLSLGAQASPVDVAITLSVEPELAIDVALTVPGDAGGHSRFALATSWGGVGPKRKDLENFVAFDGEGAELTVERTGPQEWAVEHEPGAIVTIAATLFENDLRGSFEGAQHHRPLLESRLFHASGHLFLPVPDYLDWDVQREVTVRFRGFEEAGWRTVSSFGVGSEVTARASLAELRDALFVGGPIPLMEREIAGGTLVVSVDTTPWSFDPEELADLVAAIVELERESMADDEAGFYWVNALAVGPPIERGYQFSGTGLTNAFTLFLQPNIDLAPDAEARIPVLMLLAHECFHEWVGKRIRTALPEGAHKWFFEGFVEHMARRILLDGGLLTEEDYARDLNRVLFEYHTSPARDITAQEMSDRFWEDSAVRRMGYLRGDVVAMRLDHALRSESDGRATLIDLLCELQGEATATGERFDSERLLARMAERIDGETAAELRRVVFDGAIASLPGDVFGAGYQIVVEERATFDPGFDLRASIRDRRVVGLRSGSRAAEAGLEEGSILSGLSVETGRTDREAEVTIETEAGQRTIRYLPVGPPIELPVVSVEETG
jgi:predicted metalloprotease with PDZ domain